MAPYFRQLPILFQAWVPLTPYLEYVIALLEPWVPNCMKAPGTRPAFEHPFPTLHAPNKP